MSTEFHALTISSVEKLTRDAVAISFDVPAELADEYRYIQGQHITLKADIDGQDIRRSYSICNSASDQKLTVGVKRIESGIFSNYANDSLKKGMTLEVMPPQGHFYTQVSEQNRKHYLLIAAGSGITPMLSQVQTILESEPDSQVTLLFGNKSTPFMMFREKLSFIKSQYMTRFVWINLFTREESESELFNGRICGDKLLAMHQAKLININGFDEAFLCGPEAMINDVAACLKAQGMSDDNVHYELFYADSAEQKAKESQAARAEKFGEKTAKVSVKVAGRKTLMDLSMVGQNILDAAMDNGADLPFSCKGGVCATCKAKVIKGKVEMDFNHSLTEQEVADGMILTCQAHPITEEVEVDFDVV